MRNSNTDPTPNPSPTREGGESEEGERVGFSLRFSPTWEGRVGGRGKSRLFSAVLPYKGGERVGRKEGERVGFSLRFSPPL